MGFLKENNDYNYVINERLYLDQVYNTVIFELIFYFFDFKFAINVYRESLFIVTIVRIYGA